VKSFFRSIHIKIIFWAILPSLCVMGGITLLTSITIKNTALEVVIERDVVLAKFTGKRLSENLQKYPLFLKNLAKQKPFREIDTADMGTAVDKKTNWQHIFDGGIHFFNSSGQVNWSYPSNTFYEGLTFPDQESFKILQSTLRPVFSNIKKFKKNGRNFIVIAVPVLAPDNSFAGVLAGICSVNESTIGTTYSKVLEYESGKSSYAFLVDGTSHVLYHRRSSLIGSKIDNDEAVQSVTSGLAGASATKNSSGDMVITGFAPVPGTSWGVVTQSDWGTVQNLIHFYTRFLLILIWSGGLVSALVVFYFIQRLLGPVRELTRGADQIATGNFNEIPVKHTNDEIEVLTKQFNSMARTIKASFAATQKRIEELDLAQTALSRSEERISGIINAVNDIMLMVDNRGFILWINDKGKNIFGDDTEGKKYHDILYRNQEIPEDCFIQSFISTNVESDTELQLWVDKKFQHYWCSANGVHWEATGNVNRIVIVCRNLTEKKQLRQEVLRNAQLASLGELAAGIAHEINNPVNGIINYAQIVADRWPKEDNRHAELPQKIIKEGERVAVIVSKLLSFARVDTEEKQAVDLKEVVEDTIDLTGAMLRNDFITVEIDILPKLPRCKGVKSQLLQIFLNIIGNARYALNLKYPGHNEQKKIMVSCSLHTLDNTPMLRILFKDNGIGIAKAIVDKVCNPFFSTKPPGVGTGLGLSISHGIIEEHNGELSVTSIQDQWTEIRIDLPVWQQ
jgi:PAS domain S-box-containing protein